MLFIIAKEMWDALKVMYENEKNRSRFEIYERLFELKQGDKFVLEFYGELKGLINELDMHQPLVTNTETLSGSSRSRIVKVLVRLESICSIPGAGLDTGRR